jgi:pimeloyl-ACP methyl ester carboxylesterase
MVEQMDIITTGSGPRVVIAVHGIQGTRAVWQAVADGLRDEATFVLPNLRGRAGAIRGSGPDDYTLDRYADDLAAAVDRYVPTGEYWLAGWSLGVSVVLKYLSRSGGRTPKALLLASGTVTLRDVAWFSTTEWDVLLTEVELRERRLRLAQAADHDAVAWTWRAICDTDQAAQAALIDVQATIVHGDSDQDCPLSCATKLSQSLSQQSRNASLHIIRGAGHGIPATHPHHLSSALREVFQISTQSGGPST